MDDYKSFSFGSQKLNNSVSTYLFYSIAEEDGVDSDLALNLTQIARSHKSHNSTSIYIQATNKDGSINKVAYNLFKRGHFGWLYDYLIGFNIQFDKKSLNMTEKTHLIENIRSDITPIHTEQIAEFITTSLADTLSSNFESKYEMLVKDIQNKRHSLIQLLSNFTKEEISMVIKKLACSELPSKDINAQCLIYPKCNYPALTSCYSCEYVIPGNLFLIQLNIKICDLLNEIDKLDDVILITKSSKFLLHALFIWKEARLQFGDTYVDSFIPFNKTRSKLEKVSNKIIFNF